MEDITYADCAHSKKVCKGFEIKKLGEYHYLYIQSNKLLLANIFGNFRDMCFKIYELDPEKTSFSSCISMGSSFKKD